MNHYPAERFALQWAQKYIEQFGGDPEKVTMYDVGFLHQELSLTPTFS